MSEFSLEHPPLGDEMEDDEVSTIPCSKCGRMQRIINIEQLAGRVITRTAEAYDSRDLLGIFFADNSFIVLAGSNGYGDHGSAVVYEEDLTIREQLDLGLIDQATFDAATHDEREARGQRTREFELRKLAELTKKYGKL